MTSRSNPDWLKQLIADEGDASLIEVQERDVLFDALQAAADPRPLDAQRHQQLLQNALLGSTATRGDSEENPLEPASDEELAAALKTREQLEFDPLASLLRTAYRPSPLSPSVEQAIRGAALRPPRSAAATPSYVPRMVVWSAFALTAAAAVWMVIPKALFESESSFSQGPQAKLNLSRTTNPLFQQPFAASKPTERIDRIAQVRQKDLRDNRYALWGLP